MTTVSATQQQAYLAMLQGGPMPAGVTAKGMAAAGVSSQAGGSGSGGSGGDDKGTSTDEPPNPAQEVFDRLALNAGHTERRGGGGCRAPQGAGGGGAGEREHGRQE